MKNTSTDTLDTLARQADEALSASEHIIHELNESADVSEDDTEQSIRMLQHILEYRLDTQDSLVKLMQMERSLLQLLGIENLASASVNLERLNYVLGKEDVRQILSALRLLLDSILKVAGKYQQNSKTFATKRTQRGHQDKFLTTSQRLEKATKKQHQFTAHLNDIILTLDSITKREAIGPVHNHIAALQGPVSRFYQLILSGLKQSFTLYKKMNLDIKLDIQLDKVLQQANHALEHVPAYTQANKLFHPVTMDVAQETLDQRAAKRRLGHFFSF